MSNLHYDEYYQYKKTNLALQIKLLSWQFFYDNDFVTVSFRIWLSSHVE